MLPRVNVRKTPWCSNRIEFGTHADVKRWRTAYVQLRLGSSGNEIYTCWTDNAHDGRCQQYKLRYGTYFFSNRFCGSHRIILLKIQKRRTQIIPSYSSVGSVSGFGYAALFI